MRGSDAERRVAIEVIALAQFVVACNALALRVGLADVRRTLGFEHVSWLFGASLFGVVVALIGGALHSAPRCGDRR